MRPTRLPSALLFCGTERGGGGGVEGEENCPYWQDIDGDEYIKYLVLKSFDDLRLSNYGVKLLGHRTRTPTGRMKTEAPHR
jgi:hypothetical protein